jgi:hypothetical protein
MPKLLKRRVSGKPFVDSLFEILETLIECFEDRLQPLDFLEGF